MSKAGLDELMKLNVFNYNFKKDKDKKPQVGVMAQELQKVFPNSVSTDKNGYLKIRWDEMFFAAINAIKQLDAKIANAAKRTLKAESKISKLEKENLILQTEIDKLSNRVEKLKAEKK